jgi:hypothetical protein
MHGRNNFSGIRDYHGVSDAIIFSPDAREGHPPFVGPRRGEKHSGAVIRNNIIRDCQQTAFYCSGEDALFEGNTIDGVVYGRNLAVVALLAGDVTIRRNIFKDFPSYAVACSSPVTNIAVVDNEYDCGSSSNGASLFLFQDVKELSFIHNYAKMSKQNRADFLYLDRVSNAVIASNKVELNGATPVKMWGLEPTSNIRQEQNSWNAEP